MESNPGEVLVKIIEMTIEDFLDKPYWVIDILPKQVPANREGQYFKIEEYYLEHPQIDSVYRSFTNILLKLNCYFDFDVSTNGEEWVKNPAPKDMEAMVSECSSEKNMLYIILKPAEMMITISGDDTYMTIYNQTEDAIGLIGSLVASEGLFLWKPKQ